MLRSYQLGLALFVFLNSLLCGQTNSEVWKEYGFVSEASSQAEAFNVHAYKFKDLTGALAAWESMRPAEARSCNLALSCAKIGTDVLLSTGNYVIKFTGATPVQAQVDSVVNALPDRHETSRPAILTFLPQSGLVPNSARYVLGPESLKAFAPELREAKPGLEQGAEAQIATYQLRREKPIRLALFYYPTPEMARLHTADFKAQVSPHVKRSGVLVGVVFGPATPEAADTLLGRINYEAKITLNETPEPNQVKPLYRLLMNIAYAVAILSALCVTSGLIYAGMRIYRRRYGTLESEESMTILNLTGD